MGYELLLAIHVLGAVVWVGGGTAMQFMAIRARRSREPGRMATLAADAEWIGTHIFLPASLALLAAGILLVIVGQWGFTTLWVALGIGGFAFSVVVGSVFLGPESKKLAVLLRERGPEDAEVEARMNQVFLVSRIENVVLLLVVLDMTIKPGTAV